MDSTAYVLDFDATAFFVDAKIHIIDKASGKVLKMISPDEWNTYHLAPNEVASFDEFDDKDKLMEARPTPWLSYKLRGDLSDDSQWDLFIVTARAGEDNKKAIQQLVKKYITDIPIDNIYTVGDAAITHYDIPKLKKMVVKRIAESFDQVIYYDDDFNNVKAVDSLQNPRISVYHVINHSIGHTEIPL